MDGVLTKTGLAFAVLIPVGVLTALLTPANLRWSMTSLYGLAVLIYVIAYTTLLRKHVGLCFTMIYSVLEGVFLGAFSALMNDIYPGIVSTAVLATVVTAAAIVYGTQAGMLRTTPKFRRIFFFFAILGYLAFMLVSLVASVLGHPIAAIGTGFGLIVSLFGTFLASSSLVIDVENIQEGLRHGLDESEEWSLAFGLLVSLVWLYTEILRLFANSSQFRSGD